MQAVTFFIVQMATPDRVKTPIQTDALAMGNSAAGGGRKYDEDNDLYYEAAGDFSAVSGI